MTEAAEATVTLAEMEAAIEAMDLLLVRDAEFRAEEAAAPSAFTAFWAGSASASVCRDYRAGRFVTVRA